MNGDPEVWEVEERQKWLQQHQQPKKEAIHRPEEPRKAVQMPQPQRQPTPQQPSDGSDSEPEFQQPSTSAASDRSNRKRRQVIVPSAVPARRPRRLPTPEAAINAEQAEVEQPIPVAEAAVVQAEPVQQPIPVVEAAEVAIVQVEPVQQPIPVAQPIQRRRRRQAIANPENADIEKRNLPDAPPVVVKLKVIVGQKLAANDQKQVIRRLDFKAIRYGNGIVIAQGNLVGLKYQPGLNWGFVYNDPSDPIVQMDAGDEHLILMSRAGHIFTIGANNDGQLGSSRRPGLYRQRQVGLGAMRRTVLLKKVMPNGKTKKEHAIFKGISACGNTSSAITVDDTMFHCGDGLGPVLG